MAKDERSRESLRPMKIFITCVLGVYFVAGLSTFALFSSGKDKNMIPFFHWFLFALVPNEAGGTHYELRITAIDGGALPAPLLFSQAVEIVAESRSNKARDSIRRWGRALAEGRDTDAESIRKQFESTYLPRDIAYEIVAVTYKPLTRFTTGEVDSSIPLRSYKTSL